MCFTLGVIYYSISKQRFSEHETLFTALRHFTIKYYLLYIGTRKLRRYRACCKTPRNVQENLLLQIINKNKNTDYGLQFQLCNIKSLQDLRTKHPVTDYSHYEEFVKRIAKGQKHVLTSEKISRLMLTSGTTGKAKQIPRDENFVSRARVLGEALQYEMFPGIQPMQKKCLMHCNVQTPKK